jgi:hypothetical protein
MMHFNLCQLIERSDINEEIRGVLNSSFLLTLDLSDLFDLSLRVR